MTIIVPQSYRRSARRMRLSRCALRVGDGAADGAAEWRARVHSLGCADGRPKRSAGANTSHRVGMSAAIVFVTGHGDVPTTVQTIRSVRKTSSPRPYPKETLLRSIEGEPMFDMRKCGRQDNRIAALRSLHSQLTPREREVFALLRSRQAHKRSPMRWAPPNARQNASPQCDAETSDSIACGACSICRTAAD